jgi:hypothetical protein
VTRSGRSRARWGYEPPGPPPDLLPLRRLTAGLIAGLIGALLLASARPAAAEPLRVVVRHAGGGDDVAVERLAGHVVDLDVESIAEEGALEKTLDAQIAAADALADQHDAAAVVWFSADRRRIVVVVATPRERRVFVREIDAGDPSANAEAAAQAARTAIRALSLGGTIGVELPEPEPEPEPEPVPVPDPSPSLRWHGGGGWQVALDRGADAGAHAAWQRLGVSRGALGVSLELSLGPPLRKDTGDVAVELSRGAALAVVELRRGRFRFGLGAGPVLYHRATVDVEPGLEATDSSAQVAFGVAPAIRWVLQPRGAGWGVELAVGVDAVIGAPELAVDQGGMVETLAEIATLQPRIGLGIVVGP